MLDKENKNPEGQKQSKTSSDKTKSGHAAVVLAALSLVPQSLISTGDFSESSEKSLSDKASRTADVLAEQAGREAANALARKEKEKEDQQEDRSRGRDDDSPGHMSHSSHSSHFSSREQ